MKTLVGSLSDSNPVQTLLQNKSQGRLQIASWNLFKLMSKIEDVLYFYETGEISKIRQFLILWKQS